MRNNERFRLNEDIIDALDPKEDEVTSSEVASVSDKVDPGHYMFAFRVYTRGMNFSGEDGRAVQILYDWLIAARDLMEDAIESVKSVDNVMTSEVTVGYDAPVTINLFNTGYRNLMMCVDEKNFGKNPWEWDDFFLKYTFDANFKNATQIFAFYKRIIIKFFNRNYKHLHFDLTKYFIGLEGKKPIEIDSSRVDEVVFDEDQINEITELCEYWLGTNEYDKAKLYTELGYNNINDILWQYFYPKKDYQMTLPLAVYDGDVKVIGHTDRIGPTQDKNCYAYEKYPCAQMLTWFHLDGYKECSTSSPWSNMWHNQDAKKKLMDFCENTGFTTYFIKDTERDPVVLMLFDKLFYDDKKDQYFSLALESDSTANGLTWVSQLACIMSREEAEQKIRDFFGYVHLDELYDEDEEYYDEDEEFEFSDGEDEEENED